MLALCARSAPPMPPAVGQLERSRARPPSKIPGGPSSARSLRLWGIFTGSPAGSMISPHDNPGRSFAPSSLRSSRVVAAIARPGVSDLHGGRRVGFVRASRLLVATALAALIGAPSLAAARILHLTCRDGVVPPRTWCPVGCRRPIRCDADEQCNGVCTFAIRLCGEVACLFTRAGRPPLCQGQDAIMQVRRASPPNEVMPAACARHGGRCAALRFPRRA